MYRSSLLALVLLLATGVVSAGGQAFQGRVSTNGGTSPVSGAQVFLFYRETVASDWVPFADASADGNGNYLILPDGGPSFPVGDYKLFTFNGAGLVDEIWGPPPLRAKGLGNFSCSQRECVQDIDGQGAPINVPDGASATFTADFDLSPGNFVTGNVADTGAVAPENARVCVYEATSDEERFCTFTDASGNYQTAGFTLTDVHVAVTETRDFGVFSTCDGTGEQAGNPDAYMVAEVADGASGYFAYRGGNVVDLTSADTITAGPTGVTQNFTLERGAVFCGFVRDESGTGLPGHFVKFYDPQGDLVYFTDFARDIDVTGGVERYETRALPAGTYYFVGGSIETVPTPYVKEIFDNDDGIYCPSDSCALRAPVEGQSRTVAVGSETIIDFELAAGAVISGTMNGQVVTKRASGKGTPSPLDGVRVCAFDVAGQPIDACTFSAAGSYTFPLLPRRQLKLYTDGLGAGSVYQPRFSGGTTALPLDFANAGVVDLTTGDKVENFLLPPGGRIAGQVVDDDSGDPLDFFEVEVYTQAGVFLTKAVSAGGPRRKGPIMEFQPGSYVTLGLPPANYRIVLEGTDEPGANGEQYIDEIYDGGPGIYCFRTGNGCDPSIFGSAVFSVSTGDNTLNMDLTLGGALSGRVDPALAPGTGIPGAVVRVFDNVGAPYVDLVADGAGIYTAVLPPASYFLQSDVPGFINEVYDNKPCPTADCGAGFPPAGITPTSVNVTTATPAGMRDFLLDPERYTIAGTVTDSAGALAGAEVCAFAGANEFASAGCTMSGPDGSYEIGNLLAGDYAVAASADERIAELFDDRPCDGACEPASGDTITLGPSAGGVDFELGTVVYTISGLVAEAQPAAKGVPVIEGAQVCAFDAAGDPVGTCGTTAAAGEYTVTDLPAGTYYLSATAAGFEPQVYDGVTCDGACVPTDGTPVVLGPSATGIDFTLTPLVDEFNVSGTVFEGPATSAKGLAGLAGATVCFFDDGGAAAGACVQTAGDGSYLSEPLGSGTYFARASGDGFETSLYDGLPCVDDCDVTGGTPIVVSAPVTGIDFVLAPLATGAVEGTVTLDLNGAPLELVDVFLVDGAGMPVGSASSDGTGDYRIDDIPAGTYFAYADGSRRGFFSEIHVGADTDGVACAPATCAADAAATGSMIVVADGATVLAIDFALDAGSEITGPTAMALDEAGTAVAICGTRMAIGVPGDDTAGEDAGAVLVYERQGTGYVFFEKLLPMPDDPGESVDGLRYGASLDCSGDTLVIGAPADGAAAKGGAAGGAKESVWVMQQAGNGAGFQQLQQVIASNLGMQQGSGFGSNVAIQGQTMAVGAPGQDGKGAVSVITNSGPTQFPWQQVTMLADPGANDGAQFGAAVDVGANGEIGVGAPNQMAGPGNLTSGVAQMFTNIAGTDNWNNVGKITNPNGPAVGDAFGSSVSVNGLTIAVGAPGDDTMGENAGAASIFQLSGGGFVSIANLLPGNGMGGAAFGSAVSLAGGQLAVGAQNGNGGTGSAFLFGLVGNSWQQTGQVLPRFGEAGAGFGAALAYDGSTLVVGAPGANVAGLRSGRVEAFTDPDRLVRLGFED